MKKSIAKQEQKTVEYKGTTFILQPGHKVFECNLKTGLVKEHPIKKKLNILFWQKPIYQVTYLPDIIHRPAFDIHKARINFKEMTSQLRKENPNFKIH